MPEAWCQAPDARFLFSFTSKFHLDRVGPMASPASDAGDFSLIVVEVDAAILDEAAGAPSEAFRLDPGVTQQILRSAPIVFARGLTKHEIKAITPKLVD